MAGHNKWSKIKHKKGANDAKRGKVWTKLIRELTIASKAGGPDPDGNARLRKAIDDARAANVPKDTIQKAIQRPHSSDAGADYEDLVYEGYGPAGVALYIQCATDNRNRTASEVGAALRKHGGNLGKSGSVAHQFKKAGVFMLEKGESNPELAEDRLLELGMDAGLDEVFESDDGFELRCDASAFQELKDVLTNASVRLAHSDIEMVPLLSMELAGDSLETFERLIEKLEDLDDVQRVWSNFEAAS